MLPQSRLSLTRSGRVLFLTKDPGLLTQQLRGDLNLTLADISPDDLMDDVSTDVIAPIWACFAHRPEDIARHAYAGITTFGRRLFPENALRDGKFEVVVSGRRKGIGSAREMAVQAEKYSGVRAVVAASFAPTYQRNCVNLGVIPTGFDQLLRLQNGESLALDECLPFAPSLTLDVLRSGGLLAWSGAPRAETTPPAQVRPSTGPLNLVEKLFVNHRTGGAPSSLATEVGDVGVMRVDRGYSHEFASAQVHDLLRFTFGSRYRVARPECFAVFEDHLTLAETQPFSSEHLQEIHTLRALQHAFQRHSGVRDYTAKDGVSLGICHQVAREEFVNPGDLVTATDSHVSTLGAIAALGMPVGATQYASILVSGTAVVPVPETVRIALSGELPLFATARDVALFVIAQTRASEATLGRAIELGGAALPGLSVDERATLANMAPECGAETAVVEADARTLLWIAQNRADWDSTDTEMHSLRPDESATYAALLSVDLSLIRPMVVSPGRVVRGLASDPESVTSVESLGGLPITIAYCGGCGGGKFDDLAYCARVLEQATAVGRSVPSSVRFYVQPASRLVAAQARYAGILRILQSAGAIVLAPGCGACCGCGPGTSQTDEDVVVATSSRSHGSRGYRGRLYLASPLTVATSAIVGQLVDHSSARLRSRAPRRRATG